LKFYNNTLLHLLLSSKLYPILIYYLHQTKGMSLKIIFILYFILPLTLFSSSVVDTVVEQM